ncbi:MAG: hypothetical protein JWP29_2323 [Rhodoferax sp.]|nr:hypothetical protein [Rhodoferax sp.]
MAQMNEAEKEQVALLIEKIKRSMPNVHRAIQAKAAKVGNEAYALVRRGLRGEANCFYAFEAGQVVGTPFSVTDVMDVVAVNMVRFGCAHVCIFWEELEGATDGAH